MGDDQYRRGGARTGSHYGQPPPFRALFEAEG